MLSSGSDRMRVAFLLRTNSPDVHSQSGPRRDEPMGRPLLQTTTTARTTSQWEQSVKLPPILPSLRIESQSKEARQPPGSPESSTDSADHSDISMSATRAARPAYNDEQKFYIMYSRIVLGLSWPDIECKCVRETTSVRRELTCAPLSCRHFR